MGTIQLNYKLSKIIANFIIYIPQVHQATFHQMATCDQPISSPQSNQINGQSKTQTLTQKDNPEIEFISQFLELPNKQTSDHNLDKTEEQEKEQIPTIHSEIFSRKSENLENSSEIGKSKSIFHNFQKHLIITLKHNIKMTKANFKRDPIITLAQQIWKIFQQSKYCSKKVLHFIFGVVSSSKPQNHSEIKHLQCSQFESIVKEHSQLSIAQAQYYLREQAARQGRKMLTKKIFQRRRMQKSEEFHQYFSQFLTEIEQGPINRRMPKCNKIDILNKLKEEEF